MTARAADSMLLEISTVPQCLRGWPSRLVLVGGILMILTLFLPWWGVWLRMPLDPLPGGQADATAELVRRESQGVPFYRQYQVERRARRVVARAGEGQEDAILLWGWNVGAAIGAAGFGVLIIAVTLAWMFVPMMRLFAWAASLVTFSLAVALGLWAWTWWIRAPGEDFPPLLSQSVLAGPPVAMAAALLTAVSSVFTGACGLVAMFGRRSAAPMQGEV